ncbi:MAG: multi-sensor signal transduction histidine kinase [Acidobacteriaceae bacterium]|nr:multi-sensor signal transduction histidine kinase [Acidobacteriaceae bacterium]
MLAAFALVILATAAMLDLSVHRSWENSLRQEIERNLRQKTVMFAHRVNTDRQTRSVQDIVSQEGQAAGARATLIDVTGRVMADSEAAASSIDNIASLPEFAAALRGNIGSDTRQARVFGSPYLYIAAPVEGGAVRLAYSLSDIDEATSHLQNALLIASGVALLIGVVIAGIAAQTMARRLQRIVKFASQMAAGDLAARIPQDSDDEIGQVAAALDKTAHDLEGKFAALQTSQRQLETLLNSMQDAVIAIGPDQRVQWANQMMDKLIRQHTRLNAPIVETVRDPDFLRALRNASQSRTVSTARATSILPSHTFDVTAAPMPGGGAVAVLRDLTETERVEKTRRDFIANVSHELRTPLTSIQGYTETLLDSAAEHDHVRDFLEIIRKNASRMSRLTEDLLTLARVESGEQRFELRAVTPEELLQEAVESFEDLARAQGVVVRIEKVAPGLVNADSEAIHQVLSNLIDNALKYGGSGGEILLGARPVDQVIEFYVRDLGPGIPSEHLRRLFERFYRVDKARSRESGGTGLGLAIAKHIVLAHGGTIRAESELNHGCSFLFTLPVS